MCIAVLLCFGAVTSTAGAVTYGLGDAGLSAFGDSPSFHAFCGWNGTSCGHGGLNIRSTRLVVPYDALGTYDSASGNCISTAGDANNWVWYNGAQTPTSQALYSWLGEAVKDGLQPMFSISWGNSNMTGEADDPRSPTQSGYQCGLEALMHAAGPGWNRWVHSWEIFNEPEQGLCASAAATFFSLAKKAAVVEGRTADTLVAGAFADNDDPLDGTNHPDCGHRSGDWFIRDYVADIKSAGLTPAVWSWHPYDDVDASYTGTSTWHQTGDLALYLNEQFPSHPAFWITEAGIALTDTKYGSDVNGNPLAQANAAKGFAALANAPHQAYSGQIARLYWYQYQTYGDGVSQGSDTWDSALLGITSPAWSENGYGVPRASYCVLAYGDTPQAAVADNRCDYQATPHIPWTDWEDPSS